MNKNISEISFLGYIFILFLSFTSCKNDEVSNTQRSVNCDCSGDYSVVLKDTLARLTSSGTIVIKDASKAVFKELAPCNISKISNLAASIDSSYSYKVSGGVRPPCVSNGVAYLWTIDITAISKKDN